MGWSRSRGSLDDPLTRRATTKQEPGQKKSSANNGMPILALDNVFFEPGPHNGDSNRRLPACGNLPASAQGPYLFMPDRPFWMPSAAHGAEGMPMNLNPLST